MYLNRRVFVMFCLVEAEQINPTFLAWCKQNYLTFLYGGSRILSQFVFGGSRKVFCFMGTEQGVKVPRYLG